MDRRTASTEVHELLQLLAEPYRGPIGQRANVAGPGAAIERRVSVIGDAIRGVTVRSRVRRIRSVTWTLAHAFLTMSAVGTLIFGGPLSVVVALLAFRVGGSLLQPVPGTAADVPTTIELEKTRPSDAWQVAWKACVITQLDDAAALFGVAAYLFINDRTAWGSAVMLAVLAQLAGTLFRVAAVQDGIVLRRLVLERVCRNGSLLIGVFAASILQPGAPADAFPIIAAAAAGGLVFGIGEIARVASAASAGRRIDETSTMDEMVWRRTSNLLPVLQRGVQADVVEMRRSRPADFSKDDSVSVLAG